MVQLTAESGGGIKTYEYDSFGNEVKPDSKDDNPFRCCGEYYDKETEEIYLRARYYQPELGRFLTRDTYTGEEDEPESLHLYAYCENDGVNAWDPSGHKIKLAGGTESQKREYNRAIKYLKTSKTAKKLIKKIRKAKQTFKIKFVKGTENDSYDEKKKIIRWDPEEVYGGS